MGKRQWKEREKILLLERIGKLHQNGYSLTDALNMIRLHHEGKRKEDLELCISLLKQGEAFHHILDHLDYPKLITGYFYFAEHNGDLGNGLINGSMMLKIKLKHTNELRKTLRYPLFLLFLLLILFIAMNHILLPRFLSLYDTLAIDLPLVTTLFMKAMRFTPYLLVGFLLLIGLFVVYFLFYYKRKTPIEKMSLIVKIPIVNRFVTIYNTYFFSHQLGLLLKGGLSILDVLSVFEGQTYIPFFQAEAQALRKELTQGESFAALMEQRSYYEQDFSLIIKHGQANGSLPEHLLPYSEHLIQELEERIVTVTSTLQPTLLFAISLTLILLFLSVMQPVLKLINGI